MLTIPEQMSAAVKTNAEAQHTIFANLFDKLHERLEELTRLNMEVVKASLAESTAYARELIGAKNSQDFFSISTAHNQREIQSATYYANEAMRIVSATKDVCHRAMTENIAETSRYGSGLLMEFTKNIPSTTEQMADLVKTTWSASSDAVTKTVDENAATQQKEQSKDAPTNQSARKNNPDQTGNRTTH
ncbi:phasin family protein [Glaciimonas sp. PAMC28666]|uniref:phasin family protein n=1 Tax=Glaciimonas sp. PAMC28666 TaxID=2807626 RepID=UPI001963AF35|nr:phasin family protein [Glaciimonas sp. PAMC28666]QRX83746.1 phasin family protein [Glaciimonas sp. PAMC28666]